MKAAVDNGPSLLKKFEKLLDRFDYGRTPLRVEFHDCVLQTIMRDTRLIPRQLIESLAQRPRVNVSSQGLVICSFVRPCHSVNENTAVCSVALTENGKHCVIVGVSSNNFITIADMHEFFSSYFGGLSKFYAHAKHAIAIENAFGGAGYNIDLINRIATKYLRHVNFINQDPRHDGVCVSRMQESDAHASLIQRLYTDELHIAQRFVTNEEKALATLFEQMSRVREYECLRPLKTQLNEQWESLAMASYYAVQFMLRDRYVSPCSKL